MRPLLIINKNDLFTKPCSRYNNLPDEFDAIEEIEKRCYDLESYEYDLIWLIANCRKAQTDEMLKYYLSFNPNSNSLKWLFFICPLIKTPELEKHFKTLERQVGFVFGAPVKYVLAENMDLANCLREYNKIK